MIEIKKNNKETDLPLFKHGVYIEDIIWPRGDGKILFNCWKIFHLFAVLTREKFFFNTRREISYLQATMSCSIYYINTNEIPTILLK